MLLKFRQAITPGVLSLIALVAAYGSTGDWDATEWSITATGLILTFLSFFQANVPGWMWLKAVIPGITINIAVLTDVLRTGDFDAKLWIPMGVSVVTILLNLGIPNEPGAEVFNPADPVPGENAPAPGGNVRRMIHVLVPQPRRLATGCALVALAIVAFA